MPQMEIKSYLVAQGEFPNNIDECEGYIITGSPASSYDPEPWIIKLEEFIRQCNSHQKKLLGICFGHQIIAKALGGEVVKSDKGWGVGVMPIEVVEYKPWMSPQDKNQYNMLYSHQDQVIKLPEAATLLAASNFCPISAYSIGEHIFSLQGHPEFTRDYAKKRYDSREEKLGKQTYQQAIATLSNPTDEILIGKWILNFFKSS